MKIFQSIQEYFVMLGIDQHQSIQKHPLNAKNLVAFFTFGCSVIFTFIFTFYVAESLVEYANSILMGSMFLMITIVFAVNVFSMKNMFTFIDRLEMIKVSLFSLA